MSKGKIGLTEKRSRNPGKNQLRRFGEGNFRRVEENSYGGKTQVLRGADRQKGGKRGFGQRRSKNRNIAKGLGREDRAGYVPDPVPEKAKQ